VSKKETFLIGERFLIDTGAVEIVEMVSLPAWNDVSRHFVVAIRWLSGSKKGGFDTACLDRLFKIDDDYVMPEDLD